MDTSELIQLLKKNHGSSGKTDMNDLLVIAEELEAYEAEKNLMGNYLNAIAKVRNRAELLAVINIQLKMLFYFYECSIYLLAEERKIMYPFLNDTEQPLPDENGAYLFLNGNLLVGKDVCEQIIEDEGPLFFKLDNLPCKKIPDVVKTKQRAGIKEIATIRLELTDGETAVVVFYSDGKKPLDESCRPVFGRVGMPLSIAVRNILSNEKIDRQLKEISKLKFQLEEENQYLQEQIETKYNYTEIIGAGKEMQKVFHLMSQVAGANSTVLILGETGTGKELIARGIHNSSARKEKLMVKVNCAALPANLIESELFGHERGSFTGATERRLGKFELANNGTLFLDEIGEMPLDLQVKLLRALQEREIERVGGKGPIKVNVRIIAATNKNLEKEVAAGNFRSDLYYRLNVFPITLPSLRNRAEDIPVLASHFIERYAKSCGKKISSISQRAQQELITYSWPGNVRELEHLIERSILLSSGPTLKEIFLPQKGITDSAIHLPENERVKTLDDNERDHILNIMIKCKGKISGFGGAAELLGVPPSTLNSKIGKLGITKDQWIEKLTAIATK
jgi:formate hydrogenlyase transcriptional activator